MRCSLLTIMILGHSATLFAQAPGRACCEMKILSRPESPAELTITLTNISQPKVTVFYLSSETDFKMRVTSDTGQEANRTEYGKRLVEQEHGGSRKLKHLNTGDTHTQRLDLRPLYELRPGTYNVELTRDVFIGDTRVQLEATAKISFSPARSVIRRDR
jgi:hypothetical protein